MNVLKGKIETITVSGNLSMVRINVENVPFSSIVIDTPDTVPYLKPGNAVKVIFKETEVIIGKGAGLAVSLQNRLPGVIRSISQGEILSKVILDTSAGTVVSIITTRAVAQLHLIEGLEIIAMIKTNEVMLAENQEDD